MIQAKVIADSICNGNRITTMEVVLPRFILAELNTHRMFSKNAASSRAIPFKKMLKEVEENPFVPIAFQEAHKGMQGTEYITDELSVQGCKREWLDGASKAIVYSKRLAYYEVTKQLCNRLLEPFLWQKVLITATEWGNFFELRCPRYSTPVMGEGFFAKSWKELVENHSDEDNIKKLEGMSVVEKLQHNTGQSEIHMMALAEAMYDAYRESIPYELYPGEWHIPYKGGIKFNDGFLMGLEEHDSSKETLDEFMSRQAIKVATARCARLSYQTLGADPKIDYEADIRLHDDLLESGHFSPFEHCARAMDAEEFNILYGKIEAGKVNPGWCRNFRGWIQYREFVN